ncbi:MAG TPA: gamma-glutamyltransferase [Ktedonobacteraceae bacterium]|nr:gamma-glutamyltransferase [Ktedonobacteraceae bacterium]
MFSEQPVYGTRGMVACANYLATQAGLQILTSGGNAIDAAVAANLVMTVVYPSTCSAGGDVFMLIWEARTRRLYALNGSGRAPAGMTPELFVEKKLRKIPERGPLSITVPGAIDGWFEALERFGSLPVEQVFAPAIGYAEDGMPITVKMSGWFRDAQSLLKQWSSSAETYLKDGRPLQPGQILRQPDLARSYRMLAREGRDAFYHGPLGRTLTDYVELSGGVLAMADLEHHHSDWVEPISTNYRGYDVYETAPNSQGIAALEILNIIEGYDLKAMGYQMPETLHVLLEAKKLAFADRDRYVSDPAFVDVPVARLLDKDYAAKQRARIKLERATPYFAPGLEKEGDTMYLCVADREGNVVSLIQSLYNSFGSGIVGGATGMLLHNRGSYFSLDPRHVNYLQPGKRTMHTLTAAMVLRSGTPYLVLGAMGGDGQPQTHVQLLTNIIDFGLDVQQAITAPRWRSGRFETQTSRTSEVAGQRTLDDQYERVVSEMVTLERRFPTGTALALDLLGHYVSVDGPWEDRMGHAQAIAINPQTHVFEGAADPRCDGLALGW